jgi:hypothetical protein
MSKLDQIEMDQKPRLLWVGDSPNSNSGYARVIRELGNYLTQKYNLTVFGINNHVSPFIERQYNVVDALDSTGIMGFNKLLMVINSWKPNIIIFLSDAAIISGYLKNISMLSDSKNIVKIAYLCVDYENILKTQATVLDENLDGLLVMTKFAEEECRKAGISKPIHIIPHGFNEKQFHFIDKKVCIDTLNQMTGSDVFTDNQFIIFSGNKNQIRKRLDITIHSYVYFLKHYWDKKRQPVLLFNCGMIDSGWNILELFRNFVRQYELNINYENENKYIMTTTLTEEHPNHNDNFINLLYNISNVGINTSMGESWGLVNFEHAGVGKPQIISNFSSLNEIFSEGVIKVETDDIFVHPVTMQSAMGQGRVVNYKKVAEAINTYYMMSSNSIKEEGKKAQNIALKYKWDQICKNCIDCISLIKDDKLIFDETDNNFEGDSYSKTITSKNTKISTIPKNNNISTKNKNEKNRKVTDISNLEVKTINSVQTKKNENKMNESHIKIDEKHNKKTTYYIEDDADLSLNIDVESDIEIEFDDISTITMSA